MHKLLIVQLLPFFLNMILNTDIQKEAKPKSNNHNNRPSDTTSPRGAASCSLSAWRRCCEETHIPLFVLVSWQRAAAPGHTSCSRVQITRQHVHSSRASSSTWAYRSRLEASCCCRFTVWMFYNWANQKFNKWFCVQPSGCMMKPSRG